MHTLIHTHTYRTRTKHHAESLSTAICQHTCNFSREPVPGEELEKDKE